MEEAIKETPTVETAVPAGTEGTAANLPDPTVTETPATATETTTEIPSPFANEPAAPTAPANTGRNEDPDYIAKAVEKGFSSILERFESEAEAPTEDSEGDGTPKNLSQADVKKMLEEYKESLKEEFYKEREREVLLQRIEKDAERVELNYLDSVNNSIKSAVDLESDRGLFLQELSKSKMTELIAMAQAQLGRAVLKPSEVKQVAKLHWELFKPQVEKFAKLPSAAKPVDKTLSPIGTANTGTVAKANPTNKMFAEFNERSKDKKMSLEEALKFKTQMFS